MDFMILRALRILLLTLAMSLLGQCAHAQQESPATKLEKQLQTVIDSIYAEHPDTVGIMVHVEMPGKNISWSGCSGSPDKTAMEADSPAWIASNTKTFVAAAILRLVEDERLDLETSVDKLLSEHTTGVLRGGDYRPETITVRHLLSHTSGIFDYASDESYFEFTRAHPRHHWTRDAQIARAMEKGKPLGPAGDLFSYADTNYLLLSEIIERATGQDFPTAIRSLIDYESQGMNQTWFLTLESKPTNAKALVHQHATELGLDTYSLDPSFDLYGGGGLASTTKDLAIFSQHLFNNKIFRKPETLALIQTKANPKQAMEFDYRLGLSTIEVNGLQGIGHGGFWATAVNYFPDLDASIAVFILERDQRTLRRDVNQALVKILQDTG